MYYCGHSTEPDPKPSVKLHVARPIVRYWVCPNCKTVNHTLIVDDWDDCDTCGLRVNVED